MAALDEAFGDEVTAVAVNYGESIDLVRDYIADTGIRSPVLLDGPTTLEGCVRLPPGEDSVYRHFEDRTGSADPGQPDPPFPLQVVLDGDGRIAYISETHQPELVIDTLRGLLGR